MKLCLDYLGRAATFAVPIALFLACGDDDDDVDLPVDTDAAVQTGGRDGASGGRDGNGGRTSSGGRPGSGGTDDSGSGGKGSGGASGKGSGGKGSGGKGSGGKGSGGKGSGGKGSGGDSPSGGSEGTIDAGADASDTPFDSGVDSESDGELDSSSDVAAGDAGEEVGFAEGGRGEDGGDDEAACQECLAMYCPGPIEAVDDKCAGGACEELQQCFLENPDCSETDPRECYCGTTPLTDCLGSFDASVANGPCRDEIAEGVGLAANAAPLQVAQQFLSPTNPAGAVFQYYICEIRECTSTSSRPGGTCFQ